MKTVSLSGALRTHVGKKDAKLLRRENKIPCVLYGGKEQIHFFIEEKPFSKILFTPHVYIVALDINGKKHHAIMQDVQYHPVTDKSLHVDFLEVFDDKPITIAVPITLNGTPKGVLKGGRLIKKSRKLTIKALPADLPDTIDIDITKLDIGHSVMVSDLKREKIEFLDSPRNVVVGVRSARAVAGAETEVTPEEEAGAAESEEAAPAE